MRKCGASSLLAALIVISSLVGCPGEGVPAATAWAEVREAICVHEVRCDRFLAASGQQGCEEMMDYMWDIDAEEVPAAEASQAAGRIRIDARALEECASFIAAMPCSGLTGVDALYLEPSCGRIVEGRVPAGEACGAIELANTTLLSECKAGWCND